MHAKALDRPVSPLQIWGLVDEKKLRAPFQRLITNGIQGKDCKWGQSPSGFLLSMLPGGWVGRVAAPSELGFVMEALWELLGCDLAHRVFVIAANPGYVQGIKTQGCNVISLILCNPCPKYVMLCEWEDLAASTSTLARLFSLPLSPLIV